MQLTFAHVQTIGAGYQPCAIHTPENIVQVVFVGGDGQIYVTNAPTPLGNFESRTFETPFKICKDVDVEYLKLKFAHSSLYAVWKNDAEDGETVPYQPGVDHDFRHRFAVWSIRQDLSKYLIDGSLEFSLDDQVVSTSMSFENPSYILSHEESTILSPGTSLRLFFRAGDSEYYLLGRYYVDKNDMSVGDGTTSVDCRNTIGKLLKDQTFNADNVYTLRNLKLLAEDILLKSSAPSYWVGETILNRGMEFPPDMSLLDGFVELIQTTLSWKLQEDLTGMICFGDKNDVHFGVAGTYEFYRNQDIWSRGVSRDDQDVYAKLCVHDDTYSIAEYRDIEFQFILGAKKTMHVSVARETLLADAQTYADDLAVLMAGMGVIETFSGPFRPHLRTGDNAKIIGPTTRLLGMITSVRHQFGKSGFSTEFTVDSGMMANKTRVSDYINKITGQQAGGQATRLY